MNRTAGWRARAVEARPEPASRVYDPQWVSPTAEASVAVAVFALLTSVETRLQRLPGAAFIEGGPVTSDWRRSLFVSSSSLLGKATSEVGERREGHVRALIPEDLSSIIR